MLLYPDPYQGMESEDMGGVEDIHQKVRDDWLLFMHSDSTPKHSYGL
jgi:hypothetical protein